MSLFSLLFTFLTSFSVFSGASTRSSAKEQSLDEDAVAPANSQNSTSIDADSAKLEDPFEDAPEVKGVEEVAPVKTVKVITETDTNSATSKTAETTGAVQSTGVAKATSEANTPKIAINEPVAAAQVNIADANDVENVNFELNGSVNVMAGRVATIEPDLDGVVSLRVIDGLDAGHVSINPDNTIAVVLTGTTQTGKVYPTFEATHSDGSTSQFKVELNVQAGLQEAGWGTGDSIYMLESDEDDRLVVEHGDEHRIVYASGSEEALTISNIAKLEGLAEDQITGKWLSQNEEYGGSEDMVLAEDAAGLLWSEIAGRFESTSNWLLLERGYEYHTIHESIGDIKSSGESELHPLYYGAWGEGDKPVLTSKVESIHPGAQNVVFQDLHLADGLRWMNSDNIILDNVTGTNFGVTFQYVEGVTIRNADFTDLIREAPSNEGELWDAASNRITAIYTAESDGILLEGNFIDHVGWADDYREDGSVDGGQPVSMYSHGIYVQLNSEDVTLRDSIIMRSASTGAQVRSGGFIEDNVFLDNNIAYNSFGGDVNEKNGNYTLSADNLITSAGFRRVDYSEGAIARGVDNGGLLSTQVDNIIAHLANPNDPDDIAEKTLTHHALQNLNETFYDDTVIWNWEGLKNPDHYIVAQNVDGLNTEVLDETTIQNFTSQLLGKPDASIADLADYLRAQADGEWDDVVDADLIIRFFQDGFGIAVDARLEEGMIRFVPNDLGDGVRWDNRLNWSTQDLPGTVEGDGVDLGGNHVVFGGTETVSQLELGASGHLQFEHGKLTINDELEVDDAGGSVEINGAGQLWTGGARGEGTLDVDVSGGRFANTGRFQAETDFTVEGGQAILAADDAVFAVTDNSTLEIVGSDAKVGFDGEEGGNAILGLADGATLSFVADETGLGEISEFRSGALGDAPNVKSGVDLGDSALDIDLTDLTSDETEFTLIAADEIINTFDAINISGLGSRDARLTVDYQQDLVILRLSDGSGNVSMDTHGSTSDFDPQDLTIWTELTNNQGTYDEALPMVDDEEFLELEV